MADSNSDTVQFGRVFPCPACGASLHVDFAACPWCDWEPRRGVS